MNLVSLKDIVFGYSHTPVLDKVSLDIESGEFVGITDQTAPLNRRS